MIKLFSKQYDALYNMERFIGNANPRDSFDTYPEFQEYFETLKKECDKRAKFLSAKVSGKVADGMKRKKEKQIERLKDPDELRGYAIYYYAKYFPSVKKLRDKLLQKNKDSDIVDSVIEGLGSIIMEQGLMEGKIRTYIEGGKNFSYIKQKMSEKGFERNNVAEYLSENYSGTSLLQEEKVRRKIRSMLSSKKSLSVIRRMLVENDEDAKIVDTVIAEFSEEEDPDFSSVKKLVEEFKKKGLGKEKIISRILMKGFKYDLVRKALEIDIESD